MATTWVHALDGPEDWWVEAFAYPTLAEAGPGYEAVAAVLRHADPLNVSVYRIEVNGEPRLVLIGQGDRDATHYPAMKQGCAAGTPVSLPIEVELALLERSRQTWKTKPGFVERRNVNEVVE